MTDLAERAVACKSWRWMTGMRSIDSNAYKWRNVSGAWIGEGHAIRTCRGQLLPDLTDPATVGALLALVREAWGDPNIWVGRRENGWACYGYLVWELAGLCFSEAEALVAALEAAP